MLFFAFICITIQPMRRFLASAWYPLLICIVLAGASLGAYAVLPVLESDASNTELQRAFAIAGWAIGPAMGVLSFLIIALLNGLRRLVRLRTVGILHPIVVLIGICPWCVLGCQLLFNEPRFTPFARLMIDVIGRQMFVSSSIACLLTLLLCIPALFTRK